MFDRAHDARVRAAAFDWLAARVQELGEVLPRDLLAQGFRYRGSRVPMLGPQGIFKPAVLEVPISITTSPNGPYDDGLGSDELEGGRAGRDPPTLHHHPGPPARPPAGLPRAGAAGLPAPVPDVLEEEDGPTLKHAIQGLHGQRIILPRRREDRPAEELLEVRYGRFRERAGVG